MCGITAYCGKDNALPFLIQGLEKLEYRGYDSAGITILDEVLTTIKCKGKLQQLTKKLQNHDLKGHTGIGHTRWATHGIPSDLNSHPHTNDKNTISIVHNGIIENYRELKEELVQKGYNFQSETDTEVIVHLLDHYYKGNLLEALQKVLKRIEGSYALCIVSSMHKDEILVTKKDSPLIVGKTRNASLAASDIPALLSYTKDIYFLKDNEIAVLKPESITFYNQQGNIISKNITVVPYDIDAAKKDGYETFMLKEIHEQPHAIKQTLKGRIKEQTVIFNELKNINFHQFNKIYLIGCGTAYHACLCGSKLLKNNIGIPVLAEVASEFRYDSPIIDKKKLAIFVSQSGETADTLAALRLAKNKKATTIAIANVLGSTISREADYVLYTCAGPEIAVASTKAYTTQLVLLTLLIYYMTQELEITMDTEILSQLKNIPQYIENILQDTDIFKKYAQLLKNKHDAYFIGRSLDYASVLEGALKLKEISYVHADAYVAGELKHGPIALIENGSIVIAVAVSKHIANKTISNIQETIARGAKVILITTRNESIENIDDVYYLPDISEVLSPIIVAIPLQLIAYYTACIKGCDVDKPRNLAKSVTVE